MTIVEYTTVYESTTSDIQREVNRLISEGWQPMGDLGIGESRITDSLGNTRTETALVQAMVKYDGTAKQ